MEDQDQPSVSVKDLLARMGKEESDLALGGRSRRRRSGANSVSVGDLTGDIPVVRDGAPRTHRADQANRKWSGWSKREDPDAHLDERDREWDFRVLSGEIERVSDEGPRDQAEPAEELDGGPSIYREESFFQERPEPPAEEPVFEAPEPVEQFWYDEAAQQEPGFLPEAEINGPQAPYASRPAEKETEPAELGDSAHHDWFAEPGAPGSQVSAWGQGTGDGADWPEATEPAEHDEKPHKRVSAFKADQLERAREVFEKRKSHGEPVHRSGFLGAVDKAAAARLPAWASIALQFVVGFLLGAVLFWGFRQLWRSDSTIFTAVLAVVVIAVLVLGARWVRRKNDWVSMGLAGLVGAWVCFGPLAISLLGR
ncbi:hypothetical protein Srot_1636 [Segniliparus rotundus DSM 44985]|uniref:Transmembrane protein n=1 Tax=Segniliparus rotundus (strain ATCC BAA-972 / CDC 1076 / CIP 108378 / DSM 44985 / JCM 13578) TaxID=640132 RepID=D6Z817_SEGRD|nr:hypothetical protein [Segniliparus rotundus]ADG98097.1 hypothetical protein Srot_1636 [Segniliparus rotundus DSM 44985]